MTEELHPGLPEEERPAAEAPAQDDMPETPEATQDVETSGAAEETAQTEETETTEAETYEATEEIDWTEKAEAPKKRSALPWILGGVIAALIVVIAVLCIRLATFKPAETPADPATTEDQPAAPSDENGQSADNAQTGEDAQPGEDGQTDEQPATDGVSYTVTEDALTDEVLDRTVAVCGDDRLTNRELPYYYWQQYYAFLNSYGAYAAYFMDTSVPFDQQACMFDETLTWQEYFLDGALNTFRSVSALWQDARLAGFQLSDEDQEYLDGLTNTVTTSAATYGFESADAYLRTAYGPAATMTGYHDFVEHYLVASAYLQALTDKENYSETDISAYFDENAENYTANGIEKTDTNMVNVRHILIQPSEQNDDGTYTDAAWADAEQKAKDLLAQWQSGEHTEDSFAYLAAENSQDPGSAANGGLYEEVYPGQMVDEFDAWCFDAARKPGDTGIVKTSYGYHIMYFSSQCEHPYWYVCAEGDYLNKISADCAEQTEAKFESTTSIENAALADVLQSGQTTE